MLYADHFRHYGQKEKEGFVFVYVIMLYDVLVQNLFWVG